MAEFRNIDEIKAYILARSHTATAIAAGKAYDIIHDVLEKYYGFEPDYYIRTERLLRSLVHPVVESTGNGWIAKVYFDTSGLDYPQGQVPLKGGGYGYATWDGETVLNAAMLGAKTKTWRNPTKIWTESKPILDAEVLTILKRELNNAGISVI